MPAKPVSKAAVNHTIGAIIINYNYARFVTDAIESVLAQDPPFDDIIVVDDGSTDGSLDIIEAYRPRVRVIAKANGGQLSACLSGIQATSTDYVYILDADDFAAPGFVRITKELLADRPAKLQFQLIGVDRDKNPIGTTFPTYSRKYDAGQMIHDNCTIGFYLCPPTSGNIFRRDVIVGMKLHLINLRDFVDGPPALAIPYLGPIKSVNKALSYYRAHGQNHSRWDRPDALLLQGEIDWFYRRWADVCNLLSLEHPPFGEDEPLYVLERRMMKMALVGGENLTGAVQLYLRRLRDAHLPRRQKLILTVWAIALILPTVPWRKKLVFARRSPINRSHVLKRIISVLTNSNRGGLATKLENEPSSTGAPLR